MMAEVDAQLLHQLLHDALAQAERLSVSGRQLTPFLLAQMSDRSDGATSQANIELLENNAHVAAEIACSLHCQ